MASHRPSARVAAPSFLLALILVSGSVAPAIARDVSRSPGGALGGAAFRTPSRATFVPSQADDAVGAVHQATQRQTEVRPTAPDLPIARPVAVSRATVASDRAAGRTIRTTSTNYHGRNHVWIPSLGIDRSISFFSCSSQAYPGNRVYRWGCAGSNNVYLFGHAGSVFAPLHDAYVSGRLHKGMTVLYAGDDGVVHRYAVRWWKVTTPDKGAWAYASQSAPSLTLQTCVGASSQYRLIVRLVQTD